MELELSPELQQRLRSAQRVTVLTGGGLARECGVPTFREAQTGEWSSYDPQDLATANAFLLTPRLVWEWFDHRRALAEAATPSEAYYALVDLEQRLPGFRLITQAIDGIHWRVGSREVIELHGNFNRYKCYDEGTLIDAWEDTGEVPPRCPRCKSLLRPDVMFFGEGVAQELVRKAQRAAAECELFLCVGVASVVEPASSLPLIAKRNGAFVIEISPQPTAYTLFADFALHGRACDILPQLAPLVGKDCDPGDPQELPRF